MYKLQLTAFVVITCVSFFCILLFSFIHAVVCDWFIYTVSQKNWATFLRPITLEILNRSLPNSAQIKDSSF